MCVYVFACECECVCVSVHVVCAKPKSQNLNTIRAASPFPIHILSTSSTWAAPPISQIFGRCCHVRHLNGRWGSGTLGLGQQLSLLIDLVHELLDERMIKFALGGVEELLVLQQAIVTFLILERLHYHIQTIQILNELGLGTLRILIFLPYKILEH